jgi:hypothetical protein
MKLFFVFIVASFVATLLTGCAATDSQGNRMSPFEGLAATGEYLGSIWTPGYDTPESGQYTSAIDGIKGKIRERGYEPNGDNWLQNQRHWRSIGRRSSYASIDIGYEADCWTYEETLIWYDREGRLQSSYYGRSGFGAGVNVGAGASIEGRGIDWSDKERRENRPLDGAYEGVLRKSKDKRRR